ncbi:hypothetical protein N7G274_006456 [Stereocaulon virgatum]|uniref:Integral membrane protein n=1 Tax=Stereocaulon virgatum TaxID=373712 RepID=A0ABR4A7G1_9LECA
MASRIHRHSTSTSFELPLALLLPPLRAYSLAYVSVTGPRLLNLLLHLYRKKPARHSAVSSTYKILKGSLAIRRFPTFCGALVAGYTFLQIPLRLLYDYYCSNARTKDGRSTRLFRARRAVPRFVAALLSAWFSLQLLNRMKPAEIHGAALDNIPGQSRGHRDALPEPEPSLPTTWSDTQPSPQVLAGRTIDLTVLAVARALDTIIANTWRRSQASRFPTTTSKYLSRHTGTVVFALSSGTIMWAWIYLPNQLPQAYNKWIASAAQVDSRLIELLREARAGRLLYGKDTGHAPILQTMCSEYDWPLEWGDPAIMIPFPCEVVHMGTGPSCHWHPVVRFARAFKFALATHLPLQLLFKARKPSPKAFRRACEEAIRSSAFLGAFVGLFYYGVCLARTRLGPKLFSRDTISPQMWDSGLCIGAGCALCGWSILIEAERRREELALFVVPRALATCLPREYDAKHLWREKAAFSLSIAVLFALANEDPRKVRGVLGRVLHGVLH